MKFLPLVLTLATMDVPAAAQTGARPTDRKPVLWMDPGDVASKDLVWGNGAADRAPKAPFTFVEEDTDGTQAKIVVRDANGREWTAKFGEEVHSSIAASRIVWALGYAADELYFVESGTIAGATGLKNAAKALGPDGSFTKAAFRLRDAKSERAKERWTFGKNPFAGSKELSGLAILMTMLNNWDIQGDRNNRILEQGDKDVYIVSDLGATFGKMGAFPSPRSKWNIADFQKEEFIEKVEGGMIDLDYEGYGGINKVPLEHAAWFSGIASKLTDRQLADAFRAAGASNAEIDAFSARLRAKIQDLQKAAPASRLRTDAVISSRGERTYRAARGPARAPAGAPGRGPDLSGLKQPLPPRLARCAYRRAVDEPDARRRLADRRRSRHAL